MPADPDLGAPRDPHPPEQGFGGFGDLARYLGFSCPDDGGQERAAEDTLTEHYRQIWANAAKPEDYAALRVHDYSGVNPQATVSAEAEGYARELYDELIRSQSRRRRRRPPPGPRPDPVDPAAQAEKLLERLEADPSTYRVYPGRVVFDAAADLDFPPVPDGYGFKGGVARKALAHALRLNVATAAVRDIDLIRMEGTPADDDRQLAERYMTDDLVNGDFGIETVFSRGEYLRTREITMNEVIFVGREITVSIPALLAAVGGVIRITQSQLNRNRGEVHPVVGLKAMRFAAVLRQEGREPRIDRFRIHDRRTRREFDFYFGLHLSRSFEAGAGLAELYVDYAREWGFVKRAGLPGAATAAEAAAILRERLAAFHLPFPDGLA